MSQFYELADQFIKMRRSLPYMKFDKAVSKKTKHEICILSYLRLHNGKAHPKELSDELLVSTARMAVLLNQLEEKKYIVREPDFDDSRQTVITLKPNGIEYLDEINTEILGFVESLFEELGTEEAVEFVRLYAKLMDFVSKRK